MEYASKLAGEPFSDHPRCTDPMLATLARMVNDATSDGGRQQLACLGPDLASAARTDAVCSATLVLTTLRRVQEGTGRNRAWNGRRPEPSCGYAVSATLVSAER